MFDLARNDDESTGLVTTGFNMNFFGNIQNNVYVNNNGNVTFTGSLSTYTPSPIASSGLAIIAPFWADVDTRNSSSALTRYGTGVVGGRNAFAADWLGVGYSASGADKLNTFQLIMIDRSDTGAGNFDFEFNYASIQWDTGAASGGQGWIMYPDNRFACARGLRQWRFRRCTRDRRAGRVRRLWQHVVRDCAEALPLTRVGKMISGAARNDHATRKSDRSSAPSP
jgi:hypothetical protein